MNVRNDFEVLGKGIIYMDSACVSLKPKQVVSAMNEYYSDFPACGGRSMHRLGNQVTRAVEDSRKTIARFFNAKPNEIVFTRNTTEAINLVAHSLGLRPRDRVLTTDKEHNSNLVPWLVDKGIVHEFVKSNPDNTFNMEEYKRKVKGVRLVSMYHTSNLDGVSIPAEDVIKIAHENGALVMLDAAQSAPHKQVDVKKLDVDFLACSGHKMLGPSGIGMLYGKIELLREMEPFMVGGDTVKDTTYEKAVFEEPPEKFEAGIQNYAGIIGFAEAVRYLGKIGMKRIAQHELQLNKTITEAFLKLGIDIIGPKDPALRGGIISFNIKGKDPHEVALMLDHSSKILIRSGAHCVHSWFNAHGLKGSARVSLYIYNTEDECKKLIDAITKIAKI
jgi:cysteine desulfurase/selenocysteine lyase